MNSRWIKIIQYLIKVDTDVTSSELATALHVSSKTIRNDIKEINRSLETENLGITSIRGKGFSLKQDKRHFIDLLGKWNKIGSNVPIEPESRIKFILETLLMNSSYVKLDDLSDMMFISRSTLQTDLKEVRGILDSYNLQLEHKPNYGVIVKGDEKQIRFCISAYLLREKLDGKKYDVAQLGNFSSEETNLIYTHLVNNLRKHHIVVADVCLQNLFTHIVLACRRIKENNMFDINNEDYFELRNTKEYEVARKILIDIERDIDIVFPEKEIAYLALHLKGTRLSNNLDDTRADLDKIMDTKIVELAQSMIQRIEEKCSLNLAGDNKLLFNLCLHLQPAINRYKQDMNIYNPMLEEIKTSYPLSFEAALIGSKVLAEVLEIQLNEDEIGFLALHIEAAQERLKTRNVRKKRCLIVCASGMGSAELLSYKLTNQFSDQLEIIGTTELYNLENTIPSDLDFIITTVPIDMQTSIPLIYVSTILGETDIKQIEIAIDGEKKKDRWYLEKEHTFINYDLSSPKEVITFLGNHLLERGLVGEDYVDSVLERESYAPTSFGNLVAIPHPIEQKTDKTFWCLMTLKKPIVWGDKPVQVVFLLNVNKSKKEDLKPMFHSLVRLVDNRSTVHQLLDCKTYHEVLKVVQQL